MLFSDFNTEGVLLIACMNAMKQYYQKNKFDYNFPEGIMPLINNHQLIALTTSESVSIRIGVEEDTSLFKLIEEQIFLVIPSHEVVYLLNHAEFTQIADWHAGDFLTYYQEGKPYRLPFMQGVYQVRIFQDKQTNILHFYFKKVENIPTNTPNRNFLELYL